MEIDRRAARSGSGSLRLEYLSLAWMVVEVAVAIGSGIAAHSITLLAFQQN
jgi:hypothetical protein